MTQTSIFLAPLGLELNNAMTVAKLLLRYPSAFPETIRSLRTLQVPVSILLKEHARRRAYLKRTCGFDVYLNPLDMTICPSIAVQGWHEPRLTELFVRLVKKGNTVVDVGANIGWFTLLAAKRVGESGLVVSFEPEPSSFALMSRSLEQNRLSNVRNFQHCVSDEDGTSTLHISPSSNRGAHSIVRDMGGDRIIVPCTKLDTAATALRIDRIHLLKIDVEGAEPRVLAGAWHLLDESRIDHIAMEWNPEAWIEHRQLLGRLVAAFDLYSVSRSLPFLILRRLSANSLPKMFMSFLYLRRHS